MIARFVTLSVFSLGLVGSAWAGSLTGPRWCLPKLFTTQSVAIDPINNFYDETTIYFDSAQQQQRVDIRFNNPNETPLSIRIYLFPDEGFSYRVNPQPDGSFTCIRGIYEIPLNPLCTTSPPAATGIGLGRRNDIVRLAPIPTEISLDDYEGLVSPESSAYCGLPMGETCHKFTPLTVTSRSLTAPGVVSSYLKYFNYQENVDPGAFTLPSECSLTVSAEKDATAPADAAQQQRIDRVLRALGVSPPAQ